MEIEMKTAGFQTNIPFNVILHLLGPSMIVTRNELAV
jgi:hypothetical protein